MPYFYSRFDGGRPRTSGQTPPPANQAPTAVDDSASTDQDVALTLPASALLGNDSDPDGGTLSILSVSAGTGGTPVLNGDGSVTFTPAPGFSGAASFTYTLSDGQGGTDTATVGVTVVAANQAPTAVDDSASTDQDVALTLPASALLGNDSDPDGGTLSVLSVSAGTGGTPVLNGDGSVTFTPAPGFSGAASFTYTLSDGQGGTDTATVSVTVVAAPTGPVTRASITEVQADGWRATDSAPITFDPVGAPDYVVAESPGHDAAGAPATLRREIPIMARVRQPYPNQTSLTAGDVALASHVYAGDTVTGVTNNSTLAHRKPVCCWLTLDGQRVAGSVTLRLAVAHWEARNGRAVAAVRLIASDGSATVDQLVTATTPVSFATSGLTTDVFEATLDLSSLAEGAVTIDAEIRPWVGPAWTASADFATYPSINFCDMRVFNVKTAAQEPIYAYCDPTGDDGTGVASLASGTAQASPFATVAAAAAAVQALDGTNASRGVLRLNPGTYTHAGFGGVATGATPLIVEASTPAQRSGTIYQDASANTLGSCPLKLVFRDLTLQKTANVTMLDSGAPLGSEAMLVLERVVVTGTGKFGAWLYRTGRTTILDSEIPDIDAFGTWGAAYKAVNVIGSRFAGGNSIYNAVASHMEGAISNGAIPAAGRDTPAGQMFLHCFMTANNPSGNILNASLPVGPAGFAVVGSVFEDQDGSISASVWIGGDGNTEAFQNTFLQGCSVIGERLNFLYTDAAPYAAKAGQVRFCAVKSMNSKSDVFETNSAAVGNWPVIHKVGWRANAYTHGDNAGSTAFGPGAWVGELPALGDVLGSLATPLDPDWANDQSGDGGGAGGGDYAPGVSSALPSYGDAALLPYSTDQSGAALTAASRIGALG